MTAERLVLGAHRCYEGLLAHSEAGTICLIHAFMEEDHARVDGPRGPRVRR